MKVLILFATIEGQTGKIADFAKQTVIDQGFTPVMIDLNNKAADVPLAGVDEVILAAPVHERRHPKPFEIYLTASHNDLSKCQTLFLSVSLSAAFADGRAEAQEYVTEMVMRTNFTPDKSVLVAGAVKNREYDYFAQQVVRHVVLRGQDYDPKDGDREFTDWVELEKTLSEFLSQNVS